MRFCLILFVCLSILTIGCKEESKKSGKDDSKADTAIIKEEIVPEKYTPELDSFMDSRDGQIYKTVVIGSQVWMAENLYYKTDSGSWAYNNNDSLAEIYGRLYNWETACKVCPEGWHLASAEEWMILKMYLDGNKMVAGQLKETDTTSWQSPDKGSVTESGFSALPSGYGYDDKFVNIGTKSYWWVSNDYSPYLDRECWILYYHTNGLIEGQSNATNKMSVRCIKDYEEDPYPDSLIDFRDGNIYKTVRIGDQCWMAENLNYRGSKESRKYDQGSSYSDIYGSLYTLTAAKKVCPDGWHLPGSAEWTSLIDYLGGEEVAGGKLKESGTTHWQSPNKGATNEYGFTALPGGYRYYYNPDYPLKNKGYCGYWWSSGSFYFKICSDDQSILSVMGNGYEGKSVRCVKDQN